MGRPPDSLADFFVGESYLFVEFVTFEKSIVRNRPDGGKMIHFFSRQSNRPGDLRDASV